ncbi:MAG: hypothetical protein NVS2B7_35920 [Herpetosiphon sp.]
MLKHCLLLIALLLTSCGRQGVSTGTGPASAVPRTGGPALETEQSIGRADAPVTLVEYGDYQ